MLIIDAHFNFALAILGVAAVTDLVSSHVKKVLALEYFTKQSLLTVYSYLKQCCIKL